MSRSFKWTLPLFFCSKRELKNPTKKIVIVANTVIRKLWKCLANVCCPHISGESLIHRIISNPAMAPISALVDLENVMHKRKIAVWLDVQSKDECPQNRNRHLKWKPPDYKQIIRKNL
jgi:hypothetical protein